MSGALTRRRALLGSAAAAIGLGVPAAIAATTPAIAATTPAIAATTPAIAQATSPEAAALQAELCRLSSAYRQACREVDEASDRTADVAAPEELFAQPDDMQLLWGRFPVDSWASPGRRWYADADLIERLRADPFRTLAGTPTKGAARRDEIVTAWDRWQAARNAADDASGYTAAQERFEVAQAAYEAFRLRLVEMRTDDPEVLTVKALALADLCRGDPSALDACIERAIKRDVGPYRDALALSLARDFLGLMGTGVLA